MSVSTPLLDTIEPDEPAIAPTGNISSKTAAPRAPVVLTPTTHNAERMATTQGDAESGLLKRVGIHTGDLMYSVRQ
ncbi:hypothetical protein H0H87_011022 [Tephrocybe sp. NHM501043]|nr:hypothetical protein H0H87_011022 [Tephrocybe sp. NHM501043]